MNESESMPRSHSDPLESGSPFQSGVRANSLRVVVLISGGGTTLKNLLDLVTAEQLDVDIRLVISSNPSAAGLRFARDAGVRTETVERSGSSSPESFRDAVFDLCRATDAELVVMGGFLKHLLIPDDFAGKVINIHPSLIPAFCGKGFYGQRVHASVLDSGARTTGCTVHFVDDRYDHGPIVLQREVSVVVNDTVETLGARVFVEECKALPEAIRRFAHQRTKAQGE